jgi:GTPase SAR1 family protein
MNSKNLPQYLSSSQIIFIVYDVTNPESFANVDDWLRLVTSYAPTAKVHLVGNKVATTFMILVDSLRLTSLPHEESQNKSMTAMFSTLPDWNPASLCQLRLERMSSKPSTK